MVKRTALEKRLRFFFAKFCISDDELHVREFASDYMLWATIGENRLSLGFRDEKAVETPFKG